MNCYEYNKYPCYGIYDSSKQGMIRNRKYKVKVLDRKGECIITKIYQNDDGDIPEVGTKCTRNIKAFEVCTQDIKYNKELQ